MATSASIHPFSPPCSKLPAWIEGKRRGLAFPSRLGWMQSSCNSCRILCTMSCFPLQPFLVFHQPSPLGTRFLANTLGITVLPFLHGIIPTRRRQILLTILRVSHSTRSLRPPSCKKPDPKKPLARPPSSHTARRIVHSPSVFHHAHTRQLGASGTVPGPRHHMHRRPMLRDLGCWATSRLPGVSLSVSDCCQRRLPNSSDWPFNVPHTNCQADEGECLTIDTVWNTCD